MVVAMMLGAGAGLGILAICWGLYPPKPSLATVLDTLHEPAGASDRRAAPQLDGWISRIGRPAAPALAAMGLPTAAVRRDLIIVERAQEQLLAEKACAALLGLLIAPGTATLMALGGVHLAWVIPGWLALVLAAAGFVLPDLAVRNQAAKRRAEFRHSLSICLDLVVISLAAGVGVETALRYASGIGSGWPFIRIRQALDAAHLARRPPWASLETLGSSLGIPELVELAASVTLAGTEGAKVRASLAAKAAALRTHELAQAEASGQAATERLSLPVVLLFAAFLLLLGFPAIAHVLADF